MFKMSRLLGTSLIVALAACSSPAEEPVPVPAPTEIIDLGALVTEGLPQEVWGRAFMEMNGFDRNNSFEVIDWTFADTVHGSNGYYTLFNHGGPHVDAPSHVGVGAGLDAYPVEAFAGPVKVFDASDFEPGWTIPPEFFETSEIAAGDIVLIYTGYVPPQSDEELPQVTSLTHEAAEFLANIPVRAFGTDSFSVLAVGATADADITDPMVRTIPIHHAFLSRSIPVYEQLRNLDRLLGRERLYFVGQPLNIADGDGMMVRPLVFAY